VVVELRTDFGVPDFVLSPPTVERLEGLSNKYLLRLGYELEVGEADLRVLLSVFEFAELEVPNEPPDSVGRSGPDALPEFGFGGREVALVGSNVGLRLNRFRQAKSPLYNSTWVTNEDRTDAPGSTKVKVTISL